MKKAIFTLAILVMAFGNLGMAQRSTKLKTPELKMVMSHYGYRGADDVPEKAIWSLLDGTMYRVTYYYDENDYFLSEEIYDLKWESEDWETYGAVTYEYDFAGNVIEACEWAWDGEDWQYEALATYTYDGDMISEVIYQYWDDDEWVNDVKEVYNFMGDVTTILIWDWNGNNWSSSELHTYTFTSTSIEVLMQYMQGGAWQNDERDSYALDFDGKITEIIVQDWVGTNWVNESMVSYDFQEGISVYDVREVFDWENGAWIHNHRSSYSYQDGNATHAYCVREEGSGLVVVDGDMEMAYGYNASSEMFFGCEIDVAYIDVTGLKENNKTSNFQIYPVPVENEIFIQADNFQKAEIYSITGQKLMESMQDSMEVNTLSSGLYIIKVYDLEGNAETQRFVIR